MKKIYTYNVKPGFRNLTVADIKANKGVKKLTQVNAKNAEEAYAAGVANIDMLICDSNNVEKVRQGKFFEIDVIETDKKKAKVKAEEICKKLLANLVIEDYKIIDGFKNS